ncbi:zinc finger BED domain-containing protein RICESLEEPER 2-like protein [Tanacetum coccineum]
MFEHGDGNKMMAWKFKQKESKKALAHMVIVDELPFSFVQREGFRHYSKINQPLFDVPCRGTTTQDCYNLYEEEKNKLLNVIQKNIGRICLTTDSWTSLGKKSYMALTGHFIDNEWKLNLVFVKDKDKILEKEEDYETIIIDSSEDEVTSSKRDINEDESFSY